MSLSSMVETPYVDSKTGIVFPMLKLKTIGVLLGIYQSHEEKKIRDAFNKEPLTVDQKARALAMTAIPDPTIEHLYDWAGTFNGSFEIVKRSLIQSGKNDTEAEEMLEVIVDPVRLREIAFEVINHPFTPKNIKVREDEEAKNKSNPLKDKEEDKKKE